MFFDTDTLMFLNQVAVSLALVGLLASTLLENKYVGASILLVACICCFTVVGSITVDVVHENFFKESKTAFVENLNDTAERINHHARLSQDAADAITEAMVFVVQSDLRQRYEIKP